MEITPPQSNFGIERMPESIYAVPLSATQKEKLSKGEQLFLQNMEIPEGTQGGPNDSIRYRLADGKVWFAEINGELNVKFLEQKQTLEIPKVILGYKLSPSEIDELKNERLVPIKIKEGLMFLQIDKQLNRVVVKTQRDLGIPKEIGGYLLTDRDKALFANNEMLPLRVYLNPETKSYFLASIRRTEDGKGLEFNSYKAIDKDQAPALIDKYNKDDKLLENTAGVTRSTQAERTTTEIKMTSLEAYQDFEKNVQAKNFSAIKDMTDKGFKTTQDQVEQLTVKFQYSEPEKESLLSSVSIAKPQKAKSQELSL